MTDNQPALTCRHFVTYTGVSLPLNLISPLDAHSVERRITYFRGYYNPQEQLIKLEKVVYGEIEFTHHYEYYPDGRIKSAQMIEGDEEPKVLDFEY